VHLRGVRESINLWIIIIVHRLTELPWDVAPEEAPGGGDFLKWFVERCTQTDIAKSDQEEIERYTNRPPYMERLHKWIDKRSTKDD
jgi:hypothetical protein